MVNLRPIERLDFLLRDKKFILAHRKINELLAHYERFLDRSQTAEDVLIKQFLDKKKSKEFFAQANTFGNVVFEVLELIGKDERFFRLLTV